MNILALDYGTKTGYCYGSDASDLQFGTWKLATDKEVTGWGKSRLTRTCDPRIARLAGYLRAFPLANMIVFEDVQFASSTYQVQLWASLRTVAWLDYPPGTQFECVPVGTLKKFATGSGTATKERMGQCFVTAGHIRIEHFLSLDDNAVDAIWIWLWAKQIFARA